MTVQGCVVQWRIAVFVLCVDVSAFGNKQFNNILAAVIGREISDRTRSMLPALAARCNSVVVSVGSFLQPEARRVNAKVK
jgi:hypothetical protein